MVDGAGGRGGLGGAARAEGSSFDCAKIGPGSIEALICKDDGLATLDRKLAEVYAAATKKAANEHPPVLKVEQRGWVKGRDECWKDADNRACVEREYRQRILELQARYRLIPSEPAVTFVCNGDPRNEVFVTFFKTDPPSLIAEHGDQTSLMIVQPSGSGAKYQGRNQTLWEHQGEATVTWGYEAPEMHCKKPSNP